MSQHTTSFPDVERDHILQTLRAHGGNRVRTARVLGIATRTLFNKLRAYRQQGAEVVPSRHHWASETKSKVTA
jgi:DNA-binding NtrC family response regulator